MNDIISNNQKFPMVLLPISSLISIYPNDKGYTTEAVEDDSDSGFHIKKVEYVLDKPNLIVNAKIECDNEFLVNHSYVSESGITWVAVSNNTLINQSPTMDKFIFPKEVVCIGGLYGCGTGIPY